MSAIMVDSKPLSPATEPGQSGNAGSASTGGLTVEGNSSPQHVPGTESSRNEVSDKDPEQADDRIIKDKDRPVLSESELGSASKEQLVDLYNQLQKYIEGAQQKHFDELSQLRETEEKLRAQQQEASKREHVLVMRLTVKEHEMQEYAAQLNELKTMMVPSTGALRSTLLDPAVNLLILRMKKELEDTKKKLEDTQNDLNAWKFTPDSNTGKRLMAKCRMLYQENEELGKMITSGRLAKLETDLALQKSLTEEMRKAQAEMDDVVQELDEDIDGMQSTICFWQEQLKKHQQNIDIGPKVISSRARRSHSPSAPDPPSIGHKYDSEGEGALEIDHGNESMDSTTVLEKTPECAFSPSYSESFSATTRTSDPKQTDESVTVKNNSALSLHTSSSMDGISEGEDDV